MVNYIIMRRSQVIDIDEISKYYVITEDGRVYSKIRNRWLKPRVNLNGYVFYSICCQGSRYGVLGAFAHTLVALKYLGNPPSEKHEVDHIDNDRGNNHYTNLQWVTHSQNMLKAYRDDGRHSYWLGKKKGALDILTRMKMANAKKKRVQYVLGDSSIVFDSIEEASSGLNTYRKKIYLCIRDSRPFRGGMLSFVQDESPI